MNSKENNNSGIKRRNFFVYLGVSLAGFVSLTKFPFKLFSSKVNKDITSGNKIKINANPLAVKRESGVKNNG